MTSLVLILTISYPSMSKDFQWKDHTPSSLIEVVSHLRKRWDDGEWKVSQVTRTLLFSALHPSATVDDLGEYRLALGHLKQIAGLQQVQVFDLLLRTGTEPALFHAYYGLRKSLLVREAEGIFLEFFSVGRAQAALLSEDFIAWARGHINGLIESDQFRTPYWIKGSCDVRGHNTSDSDDEEIYWRSWRAPKLMVMKPSRSMPYDPNEAWTRADKDETAGWLRAFQNEVHLAITNRLDEISGTLRLEIAKQGIKTAINQEVVHRSGTVASAPPVSFSPDFHSVQLFGEQIILTPRQAKLISILYEAHESGHPNVSKARLLEAIEAETSDVRDFFRKTPLWKTVVYSERRGTYRLNLRPVGPAAPEKTSPRAKTGKIPT